MNILKLASANLSVSPVNLTYINTAQDISDLTTYAHLTSLGTASSDRLIVVLVNARASVNRTITSVSLNGVGALTQAVASSTSTTISGVYYRNVASGTTGTIDIVYSGTMLNSQISVYAITGLTSFTPIDVDSTLVTASTSASLIMTTQNNGALIGTAIVSALNSTLTFSSPMITDNNSLLESRRTGACSLKTTSSSTTITATNSASTTISMSAASWG